MIVHRNVMPSDELGLPEWLADEVARARYDEDGPGLDGDIVQAELADERLPAETPVLAPVRSEMNRSLLYHCCPLKSNVLWYRNLQQLLRRAHVFNWRMSMAVARDHNCFPMEVVQRALLELWPDSLHRIQLYAVNNDRRLREVKSFRMLLESVESRDPRNAVFYAHTKGNSTYDDVRGATYWRNTMYSKLLDEADTCIEYLRQGYAAVGCNKVIWPKGRRPPYPSMLMHGNWMFAGTFFWFRSDAVYSSEKWRKIPDDRYGAEAWLSGLLEPQDCKSVFQPWRADQYPPPSPYDPRLYEREGTAIEDIELESPSYFI